MVVEGGVDREDEKLRAHLGMVIHKKDARILYHLTLAGWFPLFVSYSNEISGFIVKTGRPKEAGKPLRG